MSKHFWWMLAFVVACPVGASPILQTAELHDLTSLSLEELSNLQVTSVSKGPQKLQSAPAAIFVITQEEIRRSGITNIPEALRLAPGVEVERINSNQWSIGIRGFNSRLARSVLVLIDGRAVYSPLFAGTYWEVQDYVLQDIDRIEVIRGPGGTLWGANAVNGVINIITKSAKQTQGGLVSLGGGNEERGFTNLRYGGTVGQSGHYRAYAKYFNRAPSFHPDGNDFDAWQMGQTGFRSDWELNAQDSLTVQGDLYKGRAGEQASVGTYVPPAFQTNLQGDADLFGANLLGRWKRVTDEKSDTSLQWYYDRTSRIDLNFREFRNTFDLDFQRRFPLSERQGATFGAEYRLTNNLTDSPPTLSFDPRGRTDNLASFFVQDELTLIDQTLFLTGGNKVEHTDYSGWETEPSGRLSWTPTQTQTLWSAISRAVRTPSEVEQNLQATSILSAATTTFSRLINNSNFKSEELTAYEMGYRVQPIDPLFFDISAFFNHYDNLLSVERGTSFTETSPAPSHTVAPFLLANQLTGETHGLEVVSNWQVMPLWRLRAEYSFLQLHLRARSGSDDGTTAASTEGASPRHQALLRSSLDLPHHITLDPTLRYVDHLPSLGVASYWNMDVRVAWQATAKLALAVVGQNLFADHHAEASTLKQLKRGVYGEVTWEW